MATDKQDIGNGASAAFGTSNLLLDWTSIDLGEETIEAIPIDHLLTTGFKSMMFGDLKTGSPWVFEGNWDTENVAIVLNTPETCTVTFAKPAGQATAATYAASGAITGVKYPVLENGVLQKGTVTFTPDGNGTDPTWTDGIAT